MPADEQLEDNILTRFAQALATGAIRVIDLSQPLEAGTAISAAGNRRQTRVTNTDPPHL
jgi:hypothetical protein